MIVFVWVFFMLGEPAGTEPGTPYVQIEASPYMHDVRPDVVEADCGAQFHELYPGHPVCETGWCRQAVKVMES